MKKLIPFFICLALALPLKGQFRQCLYFEAGSTVLSPGPFFSLNNLTGYQLGKNTFTGGIRFTAEDSYREFLSGWSLSAARDFQIKSFAFSAELFFLQNPYTSLTQENNIGIWALWKQKHFEIALGNSTRIWSQSRQENDPTGTDRYIIEYRNLLYRFSFKLNGPDKAWNIILSLTDSDDFLIQQETNPMFNGRFTASVGKRGTFLFDLWYLGAGMLNLQADYFGFYTKTGMKWKF